MALGNYIRRRLLTGAIILLPVGVTLWLMYIIAKFVVRFLHLRIFPVQMLDNFGFPSWLHAILVASFELGNFLTGFLITIGLLILVGSLVRTFVGKRLMAWWESVIERIPFIRGIYGAMKQLTEAVFIAGGRQFTKVILIEYPRKGIYTMGFITGEPPKELTSQLSEQNLINVFVPSTPNPTTGWYLVVPEKEVIPIDMSVETAFQLIISGGLYSADTNEKPESKDENSSA